MKAVDFFEQTAIEEIIFHPNFRQLKLVSGMGIVADYWEITFAAGKQIRGKFKEPFGHGRHSREKHFKYRKIK